jgi:hypothetical protein
VPVPLLYARSLGSRCSGRGGPATPISARWSAEYRDGGNDRGSHRGIGLVQQPTLQHGDYTLCITTAGQQDGAADIRIRVREQLNKARTGRRDRAKCRTEYQSAAGQPTHLVGLVPVGAADAGQQLHVSATARQRRGRCGLR